MSAPNHTPPPSPSAPLPGADPVDGDDWDRLFSQPVEPAEQELVLLPEETGVPEMEPAPLAERYLGFRLGTERYAVPIARLSEVVRAHSVTPVPRVRPYLLGILSVRGAIVPVVDLRLRLTEPSAEVAPSGRSETGVRDVRQQRVLITQQAGETFGLLVDQVLHPFRLEAAAVEQPPQTLPRRLLEFVEGIARENDQIYILLDLDVVLRFDALVRRDPPGETR